MKRAKAILVKPRGLHLKPVATKYIQLLWSRLLWLGLFGALKAICALSPERVVTDYALVSAAAREKYADPKNWRLLGSADNGQSWTVLDVQSNQVFRRRLQRQVYHVREPRAYGTYRLEVQGVSSIQLAELELIGPLVGLTNEAEIQIVATASKEHPLLGPACQAFDNDPTTRWIDFGTDQNTCWLQCQLTRRTETLLTNIAQLVVVSRRLASGNPLGEKAPHILAIFTNETMRSKRTLTGYALTSANDMPSRDPRDWKLLGSNDRGRTWQVLDVRQNEIFQQRFQRRIFSLPQEASYSLYRLQIDCVRVPFGLPSGATCVQLAEIEPLYSAKDKANSGALLVSADGENPPLETVEAAFDARVSTKWLSFTEDVNTNRSSWVQWEYLSDTDQGVINLRWAKALVARRPIELQLHLAGVAVSWDPNSRIIGLLDQTGFQQFKVDSILKPPVPGDRVELAGRLELGHEIPQLSQVRLTSLEPAAAPKIMVPGQQMAKGEQFVPALLDARVTSVSEDSAQWTTLGLSGPRSERIVAKLHRSSHMPKFFAGCHLQLEGIVQAVLQEDGQLAAGIIWVPDLEHVTFVTASEKDWSDWPVYAMDRLTRTNAGRVTSGSPVRVMGGLLLQDSQRAILTDKGTNHIRVYPRVKQSLELGSRTEAIGFLAREPDGPVLELAQIRRAIAGSKSHAFEGPGDTQPAGAVTNVRDIYKRLEENPSKAFPVRVRGVITYIDLTFDTFYLQDGSDGIMIINQVDAGLAPHLRQEGLYVEVRGQADPDYKAINPENFVTVLGRGRMPEPRRHSWDYLITGQDDAQWIQIEGVVSACGDGGLTLIVAGGRLSAVVNEFDPRIQNQLLGSLVRITGVCSALRDNRNRRVGVQLLVPSKEFIEVIRPAPEDPFDLTTRKISDLAEQTTRGTNWTVRLIKTSGVVTYREPRFLFLQSENEGLRVFLRGESSVQAGDRIEAVGFAEPDGFSPKLVQALVRKIGQDRLPVPASLDLMGAELSDQEDTRVQIEGTLVGLTSRKSMQILELNDPKSDKIFSAFIPAEAEGLPTIPLGSGLRLQGVFRSDTEMMPDLGLVPTSFQLYLNSPKDIAILRRPSWWSVSHTLWVAGSLAAILLLALGWATSLRRQVLQRTEQLRIEIAEHKKTEQALETSERFMRSLVESLPQNILRKDLEGRFTFANEFFCRTIGRAMHQIIGKTDLDLFPPELAAKFRRDDAQVIATGSPFETVEENRNANGENIFVQVIKSPLLNADNQALGIQVIFWDVTEKKRAEARLEATQKAMVDASRQAGMAEVAAGVLHNVGNVLNSVNVSANLVSETVHRSKAPGLAKAVLLLREHESDLPGFFATDSRAKRLTEYLGKLADCLSGEQSSALAELQTLRKNIGHIKEIVAMQQNYAKVIGVTEKVRVTDLVEDALRLNTGTLERHEIELTREYQPDLAEIVVERHKVLQILVNLIRNAKYACDESGRRDKRMVVRITQENGCIKISTNDNGVGIAPENLTRIFNHGFTTRKDGHGFGLHSGALAAKEMGGTLIAQSDGPGKGASFTLSLPLSPGPTQPQVPDVKS